MKGATPLQNTPDAQIYTPNNNTKKHEEKLTELKGIVYNSIITAEDIFFAALIEY